MQTPALSLHPLIEQLLNFVNGLFREYRLGRTLNPDNYQQGRGEDHEQRTQGLHGERDIARGHCRLHRQERVAGGQGGTKKSRAPRSR